MPTIRFTVESVVCADCDVEEAEEYPVAMIAFHHGFGMTLIIDRCVLPGKEALPLRHGDKDLAAHCLVSLNEAFDIALKERKIFRHIGGLAESLTEPFDAPVKCARSIEGLAYLILDTRDKKKLWKAFLGNLNLSEDYISFITGALAPPKAFDVFECQRRAWVIAGRFLEFRRRGSVTLPISEFPLL
jgi:hypothetical protein